MNRRLLKFMAMLSFVALTSCSDDDRRPAETYQDIIHSRAFAGITDSIERSPNDVQLLLTRATRLSQHEFHEAATADYRKAYDLTGDEGVAMEYASNLLLANNMREAVKVLKEGSEKFPENPEFERRLAEIYLQHGDDNKAMEQIDLLLKKDSLNFEAWYEKGSLYLKNKDTASAIEALEQSFAILPVSHVGMTLANIYVSKKNARAIEICNAILARDTSAVMVDPVYMKGVFYAEVKDYNKAIEQFDECIKRDWKTTDAYIEKGIIYYEQKQTDEALKVFNLAASVSNTDADVYYWLGRCFEQKGNNSEAATNYRRALSLDDTMTEAKEALRRLNS